MDERKELEVFRTKLARVEVQIVRIEKGEKYLTTPP